MFTSVQRNIGSLLIAHQPAQACAQIGNFFGASRMDSMELNKIVAAFLVAGIAYFGLGEIAARLVHAKPLEVSALKVEGAAPAPAAAADAPAALAQIGPLLAKASADAGAADAKKLCSVCHNFNEGGSAKVGPDLYGVLLRERASVDGFAYSAALKGKPGKWTYDDLNAWLHAPKVFASGTKMAFAGIDDDHTRADVIMYLRSLAHDPAPLPNAK